MIWNDQEKNIKFSQIHANETCNKYQFFAEISRNQSLSISYDFRQREKHQLFHPRLQGRYIVELVSEIDGHKIFGIDTNRQLAEIPDSGRTRV